MQTSRVKSSKQTSFLAKRLLMFRVESWTLLHLWMFHQVVVHSVLVHWNRHCILLWYPIHQATSLLALELSWVLLYVMRLIGIIALWKEIGLLSQHSLPVQPSFPGLFVVSGHPTLLGWSDAMGLIVPMQVVQLSALDKAVPLGMDHLPAA